MMWKEQGRHKGGRNGGGESFLHRFSPRQKFVIRCLVITPCWKLWQIMSLFMESELEENRSGSSNSKHHMRSQPLNSHSLVWRGGGALPRNLPESKSPEGCALLLCDSEMQLWAPGRHSCSMLKVMGSHKERAGMGDPIALTHKTRSESLNWNFCGQICHQERNAFLGSQATIWKICMSNHNWKGKRLKSYTHFPGIKGTIHSNYSITSVTLR